MYKLLAIDMDGTTLNPNHEISEGNKIAIKKAREKGVKVVLCSGRPVEGLMQFVKQLEIDGDDDYIVAINGGMVKHIKSGEIVHTVAVTGVELREVYELSKKLDIHCHAFVEEGLIAPQITEATKLETGLNNIEIIQRDFDKISDDEIVYKVMFADLAEKIENIIDKIPQSFVDKYSIQRSGPLYLEFMKKGLNKGTALEYLCEKLEIKREEIMAIGDAGNDVDMLKFAGLGVAMGNAFEETLKVADYITKTNAEDGVAVAIEKFIL